MAGKGASSMRFENFRRIDISSAFNAFIAIFGDSLFVKKIGEFDHFSTTIGYLKKVFYLYLGVNFRLWGQTRQYFCHTHGTSKTKIFPQLITWTPSDWHWPCLELTQNVPRADAKKRQLPAGVGSRPSVGELSPAGLEVVPEGVSGLADGGVVLVEELAVGEDLPHVVHKLVAGLVAGRNLQFNHFVC
jgi:hypothetical protein